MFKQIAIVCGVVIFAGTAWASPVKLNKWNPTPPGGNGKIVSAGNKKVLHIVGTSDSDVRMLSPEYSLDKGGCYQLKFKTKSTVTHGILPCGIANINRDFASTTNESAFSFILRTGTEGSRGSISLGEFNVNGVTDYYDVDFSQIQAVNAELGDITLGEGENISGNTYTDYHDYSWQGSTIHRTLYKFNCEFNTDRWVFKKNSFVTYRYNFPFHMNSARVSINLNYYVSGKIAVKVSSDGIKYTRLGELDKVSSAEYDIPSSMLPCNNLYVKLSSITDDTHLQIDTYHFNAITDYKGNAANGKTLLIEDIQQNKGIKATWHLTKDSLAIQWKNTTAKNIDAKYTVNLNGKNTIPVSLHLPAKSTKMSRFDIPLELGNQKIKIKLISSKAVLYSAKTGIMISALRNNNYGYYIKSPVNGLDIWWCESNWKVGRDRSVPKAAATKPISMSACKGEYEAVQLVVRPDRDGMVLRNAEVSTLANGKNKLKTSDFKIYEVATVTVSKPTDYWGEVGNYPDPLPAFDRPIKLSGRQNQAIWISVYVPENQPAGAYTGKINLKTNRGSISVPFEVYVYNFAITKYSNLRSAFGICDGFFNSYCKTQTDDQRQELFDKWMKSFSEHRISPFNFSPYSPIGFDIVGDPGNRKVKLDWTAFDKAAEKYLDGYNFNCFSLQINGLGGGTYKNRIIGELDGYKAGTPEYEKLMADYLGQLENHLREKGWLNKTYMSWYDEPVEEDYDFINGVHRMIHKYAPHIKRLMTEQPEKVLLGNIDIWVGLTPKWSKKTIDERNAAGDDVWWYVCCDPKAPYCGEFIDHPGTEMRMWVWQTWQYNVHGILMWTTNWWTSCAAFPDTLQNPWDDAMSYMEGYDVPKGSRQFWGNGDGRFLYPPRRDPNTAADTDMSDPITSIRWEALRDGMEDYEYFYLLKDLINKKNNRIPADMKLRARKLLIVPETISKDMTHFTSDPRLLLNHRNKIARMIEYLEAL